MTLTILATSGAGYSAIANEEIIFVPEDVVLGDDNSVPEIEVDGFDDVRIIVEGTIANNDGGNQSPIYVTDITNGTQITIEETGHVSGQNAIQTFGAQVAVSNYGTLESLNGDTVDVGGASSVVNHGSISADATENFAMAAVEFGATGDEAELVNYGTISSRYVAVETNGNNAVIQNFGVISARDRAAIDLRGETSGHQIQNSGVITSGALGIYSFADQTFVSNTGEISGQIALQYFSASLADITQSDVQNSGTIVGTTAEGIQVGEGDISISNTGLISGALRGIEADVGASGSLTLVNSGKIESRDLSEAIYSEDGDDLIVNTGQILGDVVTGLGDDTILTTGGGLITGRVEAGSGNDVVTGGSSSDEIDGGADDDFITGGDGVDDLAGGDGIDIILGGTGADTITGGEGFDFLLGEEGADVFLFTAISDSATGEADSILDFEQGADIIDLYTIETSIAFLGTGAFSGSGGAELRTTNVGGVLSIVNFDVDGNGVSDMEIVVYGALDMTRADFGL